MHFVQANDLTFNVADRGQPHGPPVVFLNSLGTDLRVWDSVSGAFEARCRVIGYDKRGHGLSDAPPGSYSMQDHIGDLEALLDALAVDRAVICGVSVGGLIAQGFCTRHPDRVTALILCDTAAKIGTADVWNTRIELIERNGIAAVADAILERWFTPAFRQRCPTELRGWRNMLTRTPVAGYVGTAAAIRDTDMTESTRTINRPTLVVCGDQDGVTPPEVMRSLTELITGSRFEVIEQAGHLPGVEQPSAVIASVETFLSEQGIV